MPVSRIERGLMWVRRSKAAAAALALAAVVVFVVSPFVTYLWLSAEESRSHAETANTNLETETGKRTTAETNQKTAKDYSLAVLLVQPSEDDFDPVRKRVRLFGPEARSIEKTVEDLKKFVPTLGNTREGAVVGWLVHAAEAKKAAMLGDWGKAEAEYQRVADGIAQMSASPDRFEGDEYLRVLRSAMLVEMSVVRRNLGRFEAAEQSAQAALAELDQAGAAGDETELRRARRDALLEHLRTLRVIGDHDRADRVAADAVRTAEELALKPGEPSDLTAVAGCHVFLAQQPGPNVTADAVAKAAERGLAFHLRVHQSYPTMLRPAYETGEAFFLAATTAKRAGKLPEAKKNAAAGRSLLTDLAAANPDHAEIARAEVAGLLVQADLLAGEGGRAETALRVSAAANAAGRLRARFPSDVATRAALAECGLVLARLQADNDQIQDADDSLTSAVNDMTELPESVRRTPRVVLAVARVRLDLAALRLRVGRAQDSQRAAEEAVAGIRGWVKTPGGTGPVGREALELLDRCVLPVLLLPPDSAAQAVALFQELVADLDRINALSGNTALLTGRGHLLNGAVLAGAGRGGESAAALAESVRQFDAVEITKPADPVRLRVLGSGYFFAARTYQKLDRRFQWAEADRKGIALRRKWVEVCPHDFDARDCLAHSLVFLGEALIDHPVPEVEDVYAEAVKLWDELEERFPAARVALTNRVVALVGVAACRIDQDRFPQAESALNTARGLMDRVPTADAKSAEFLTAGRWYHHRSAWLRAKQNDHAGCAAAVSEMVSGRERDKDALRCAAYFLAWCRAIVERDGSLTPAERAKTAAGYADQAVKRLGEAVDAGYDDLTALESDAQYRPFAGRADFRSVLERLRTARK